MDDKLNIDENINKSIDNNINKRKEIIVNNIENGYYIKKLRYIIKI